MNVAQADFARALLAPDAAAPEGLSDPEGRRAGKRFDVYRNNVVASLTDALETAFPVVRKLVGVKNFRVLAAAYLRGHPPRTPLLMFYGETMPAFLETFAPVRSLGYLADVARLEQALREAYHAADVESADPACLAALSPEDLMAARLRLDPALRVIRSPWPVQAIWRYNSEPDAPKPAPGAEDVIVLRRVHDPEPIVLPPGAAAFLAALSRGVPLGKAHDDATDEATEFDLAAVLRLLLTSGSIADINVGEDQT